MDIDLFSDIVGNLLLDNDEVALPGLGTFVSEVMPSTFSDRGYTINPPYRRLSFRHRWSEEDSSLVDFYSRANGISSEEATRILGEFISGLEETLKTKKSVLLPGLGRLRATKENTFFFIADEDLDIYPYGIGLEPVSLKTRGLATSEDRSVSDAPEQPSSEEEVSSPSAKESAENERKRLPWSVILALSVLGLALLALIVFTLVSRLVPGSTDFLLYTPEELRILNY